MMNGRGKSDSSVVPAKSLNNAEGPAAEATEGRELAKGNLPSATRSGLRAGKARPARSSGYVKQQLEIRNSGSRRSSTTSTTLSDCGQPIWR